MEKENNFYKNSDLLTDNICSRCDGDMRIFDYENGDRYSEDGKMPCPDCEGTGTILEVV